MLKSLFIQLSYIEVGSQMRSIAKLKDVIMIVVKWGFLIYLKILSIGTFYLST